MTPKEILTFVKAGRAVFTITSTKTRTRFTYKMTKKENEDMYFIKVRNSHEYIYLGYYKNGRYLTSKKSFQSESGKEHNAIEFFLNHIENEQLKGVEFNHEGRCAVCGRPLTDPETIEIGIGKTCLKKLMEN